MITRGNPWGSPLPPGAPTPRGVAGGDAAVARAAESAHGATLAWEPAPGSDLARTLGAGSASGEPVVLPVDALAVRDHGWAVNAVTLGPAPDRLRAWHRRVPFVVEVDGREVYRGRATSVVVANGQFVRGCDLVPRGHPGDGVFEVQVYDVAFGERGALRRRLGSGSHLPHPRIHGFRARGLSVVAERAVALEIDGAARARATRLEVEVVPGAVRLVLGHVEGSGHGG